METIFIIIWLLCGIIAVWREYHGLLEYWYIMHNESYWDYDRENNKSSAIRFFLTMSPFFICCGLTYLIVNEMSSIKKSWWFTTKNK